MEQKLNKLSREKLQEIILKMSVILSENQRQKLETIIEEYSTKTAEPDQIPMASRMSQEMVDEKLAQLKIWMEQIDECELCLYAEEYEDYSEGYWDSDWITEYYDSEGIGDKITSAIQFAKDCVDDRRYQEANLIYEWLWEMNVYAEGECESEPADLEMLVENEIVHTDLKQLALLSLYAGYQVLDADKRAEDLYLYFSYSSFRSLHIEDMFYVGRENLDGTEQFWKDWIALLKTKSGDTEGRLLQEAVMRFEGVEGLVKMADENCGTHPSLYLAAIEEYDKTHNYKKIEEVGERALEKIDVRLIIRSEIALKAAYASSCLMHTENMMWFCWESFRSDSTDKNFLRLFGLEEMAKKYGVRGNEVLGSCIKGNPGGCLRNAELRQNILTENQYYTLCFYTGDFKKAIQASKNPSGSLGWSSCFIRYGIRLFLLYLYDKPVLTKAAEAVVKQVGYSEDKESRYAMSFESEMAEESRKNKTSVFWNYFQRWKQYFPIEQEERRQYVEWVEKVACKRADAIVGGQHRRQYDEVAILLAMVSEIKEDMGVQGAKQEMFAQYKKKFPRHSSFQAEMKTYFSM